jgi:hypothetical protein
MNGLFCFELKRERKSCHLFLLTVIAFKIFLTVIYKSLNFFKGKNLQEFEAV